MRRCTTCFRYSPGEPTFCTHCGRSYNVRICPRGHVNGRSAQFCAECGSEDLSTPAASETFLSRLAHWTTLLSIGAFLGILVVTLVVAVIATIDWSRIGPRLALLFLILGVLYWSVTVLPGPIRKVGRAAGKTTVKFVRSKKEDKRK